MNYLWEACLAHLGIGGGAGWRATNQRGMTDGFLDGTCHCMRDEWRGDWMWWVALVLLGMGLVPILMLVLLKLRW